MSPSKVPELPENVVLLRPDVVVKRSRRRPKRPKRVKPGTQTHLKSVTPNAPGLNSKTPVKKGKKLNAGKLITMTPASTEISLSEAEASSNLNPQRLDAAFRKLVQSLGKMELRRHFRLEAISHLDMMNRRRTHGAVVHPAFHEFRSFLLHVGRRPLPTWTLDRKNPHDPEYAPKKVEWRDKRAQANNRRNTIILTVGGETRPLADWARLRKEDPKTFRKRRANGYSDEEVVYGRNKQAPELPPEPPADTEGYIWPGSQPDKWEQGYRGFVAVAKQHPCLAGRHPLSAFTRDVFLVWVAGNILRDAKECLRRSYPGYDDPDGDPENVDPRVLADPVYRRIEVLELPWIFAVRRLQQLERDLWKCTLSRSQRFAGVINLPQDWACVFRGRW
ncbi:hypothetical protein FV242_01735 [Methylobacterium sp. WL64]|uniref:hypothetical protein n=1 Tax=Methylobacterium sp. WL64 TaxID=2603894 RepID=UPI0011C7E499|nr:hypothetical protein [Methylobacterium sp. WL64]TXN05918.1 hypothetical protein FV242_01735 [Methylobacterium sp. WL64]